MILAAKYLTYADKLYLFINPDGYFILNSPSVFSLFLFFSRVAHPKCLNLKKLQSAHAYDFIKAH